MPTGYTSKLCDEGQSFEEFVWTCARAMGFMIHMRDDSLKAPIRRPESSFDSIQHHQEELEEAKTKLAEIKAMSNEDIREKMQAAHNAELARYAKEKEKTLAVRRRLLSMRDRVEAWSPPKDFDGFKKFMLDQLKETIKWDGELPNPPEMTVCIEEWRNKTLEDWQWQLDYHTKELAKSKERHKDRVRWMDELEASVPIPNSMKG